MYPVLLALRGTREIEIAAEAEGNREIGLEDFPQHLVVELFLKTDGVLQSGIGVSIFRVQIGNDLGVFLFAQPGVGIAPTVSVKNVFARLARGDRGLRAAGVWDV